MDGRLTGAIAAAAAAATNAAVNAASVAAAAAAEACAPLPVLGGSAAVHHASFFAPMADDSRASSKSTDESPPTSLDAVRANSDGPSHSAKRPCVKSSSKSSMDAVSRRQYLERALHDVTSQNISIRKAATRYGLSKSSLCDFVRKNGITIPNRRGRRLALSDTPPAAATAAVTANAVESRRANSGERSAAGPLFDGAPALKRSRDSDEEMEAEEEEEEAVFGDAKQPMPPGGPAYAATATNSTASSLAPAPVLLTVRGRGVGARGRRARGAIIANRGGPLVSSRGGGLFSGHASFLGITAENGVLSVAELTADTKRISGEWIYLSINSDNE